MRACPDCDASRIVRAAVFDEGFWSNLALLALPFLVLGLLSTLLWREGPRESAGSDDARSGGAPHA